MSNVKTGEDAMKVDDDRLSSQKGLLCSCLFQREYIYYIYSLIPLGLSIMVPPKSRLKMALVRPRDVSAL